MRIFQSMNRPGSEEKKNTSTPWLTSGTVTKSSYRFDFCWNYWSLLSQRDLGYLVRDLSATLQISLVEVSARSFRHYKSRRDRIYVFFLFWAAYVTQKKKSWLMYVPQGWKITITSESFRFMFTIHIYFPLFLGMVMYDSEFKTKENKI